MLHSLLKSIFLLWSVIFFTGCVSPHQMVQKGELKALEKQIVAQNQYLGSMAWERFHTALVLQKTREDIFSLRLGVQTLAQRPEPVCPPPPVSPVSPPPPPPPDPSNDMYKGKKVVGAVEKVFLSPPDILLQARIDTGAATSSLDAREMHNFERDGKSWIRFHIVNPESDESVEIERPILRHVRIIQAAAETAERRPVIELRLVIGGVSQSAQFTLSDRAHLDYPVLIGRNILQDVMVVDVGKTFTVPPKINSSAQ